MGAEGAAQGAAEIYRQNVFLFAAGRCFQEKQHLRDSLHTLCCELNEADHSNSELKLNTDVLPGSRLVLDILEDGTITTQPGQLQLYTRLALRLLELPPCRTNPFGRSVPPRTGRVVSS